MWKGFWKVSPPSPHRGVAGDRHYAGSPNCCAARSNRRVLLQVMLQRRMPATALVASSYHIASMRLPVRLQVREMTVFTTGGRIHCYWHCHQRTRQFSTVHRQARLHSSFLAAPPV